MNFRATYMFESGGGRGWSESYYGIDTDLGTALSDAITLGNARLALMSNTFHAVYTKVHDLASPRIVAVANSLAFAPGTYVITTGGFDLEAADCVLVRLAGTNGHQNRKFLRGINTDVATGDRYAPVTNWLTALAAFQTVLQASPWQVAFGNLHGIPQNFEPIAQINPERVITRRTGRFFGQPAGRRLIRA